MAAASTSSRLAAGGRPGGRTLGALLIRGKLATAETPKRCRLIHGRHRVMISAAIVRYRGSYRRRFHLLWLATLLALAVAAPAGAFDPLVEAQNYNKGS